MPAFKSRGRFRREPTLSTLGRFCALGLFAILFPLTACGCRAFSQFQGHRISSPVLPVAASVQDTGEAQEQESALTYTNPATLSRFEVGTADSINNNSAVDSPGVGSQVSFFGDSTSQPDPSFCFEENACAHDCYPRLSGRDDLHTVWPHLWEDTKGMANWHNAAFLGVALGGSLALRPSVDDDVREYVAEHPKRWGKGSQALSYLADPAVQVPVLLGTWAYSIHSDDQELHDMTGSMIRAYTLTAAGTALVKTVANTDRPSDRWTNGEYGFPSGHTSTSFALAAVLDEYEGHQVGIPAYIVSGLIGWSRIDEQDHDLSDVVFGSALGYVIGKSVARRALGKDSRVQMLPYLHPTDGSSGVLFDVAF